MIKRISMVACLLAVSLLWPGRALPQTASPEALAAAKELMIASKMSDQINNALPQIMQQLKPLITRGNPKMEKDYDALMPLMMKVMNSHLDEFLNAGAHIYARHFTADEIKQVTAFYRTPAGQKFLTKQPQVMQETFALGNKFGEIVGKDVQSHIVEELRKRGHDI